MSLYPTLTVGTNSYATLAEAKSYTSTERLPDLYPVLTAWNALSDAQKTNALIMGWQDIDQCKFAGKKYEFDQAMEWPRIPTRKSGFSGQYADVDFVDVDTVWQVKIAQVEEAIAIAERKNWNLDRIVEREEIGGSVEEKNPDVILLSHVAHKFLLESGWLCEASWETEDEGGTRGEENFYGRGVNRTS